MRRRLALPLLALAAAGGLTAQEPGVVPPPQRVFSEVIDVRVVQVETVVTDRQGNRVEGLGPEDFRLQVDGEEVLVEYFSEVRAGTVAALPEVELIPAVEAETGTAAGRSFLVFVDDYFTDRRYRHRLLKNLTANVEALQPGDRMAVVRFEGYGLEVLSGWTDAEGQLAEALEELRRRTPRELVRRSLAAAPANPVERARLQARQIEEVTRAMAAAMRTFADVPGRKLLLPVTTGWPFDATLDLGSRFREASAELGDNFNLSTAEPGTESPAFRALFDALEPGGGGLDPNVDDLADITQAGHYLNARVLWPMIDTANLLGYTIYPMHVGGPQELLRMSLWIAARETGGRIATEGAANTTPLAPVVDDTGSYYVLGFSPEREWDDQHHRVQVEVVREGVRVRHRRNFLDLSRRARRAMETEAALLLGTTGGNLDVTFGDIPAGGGKVELPVSLSIPMDWVTMVPAGDGQYAGELELRVAALDKRGGRSEIPGIPIRLTGPEPPPGSHALYQTAVLIRRTEQRLVLYLYDKLSGEARSTSLEFKP